MNIALIGYGKMGKAIESVAISRGHVISLKISSSNKDQFDTAHLRNCDVAIEFTNPESAIENLKTCFDAGIPVVCGSTGWYGSIEQVKEDVEKRNASLLYASNFSVGVNIFFEINKKLAVLMSGHPGYSPSILEIHHTAKKDSPSGTAITLAEQLIEELPGKKTWVNHDSAEPTELPVISQRTDPAPGTHFVKYTSSIDDIEISHTAHNREGFAYGAVLAAEFIAGKKGVYTMKDVLKL